MLIGRVVDSTLLRQLVVPAFLQQALDTGFIGSETDFPLYKAAKHE